MGYGKSKLMNAQITDNGIMSLTARQIQYVCQQTNLIDREVSRQYAQFVNAVKDGHMTKEQFDGVLQEIWPTGNVRKLSDYLFSLCDTKQQGFLDFTHFAILNWRLSDDRSYLGFLFDMHDTRRKGYLPQDAIEPLFGSLFELIGHPSGEQSGSNISQRHIAHVVKSVGEHKNKRLSREQFLSIANTQWTDDESGDGFLLVEQSC